MHSTTTFFSFHVSNLWKIVTSTHVWGPRGRLWRIFANMREISGVAGCWRRWTQWRQWISWWQMHPHHVQRVWDNIQKGSGSVYALPRSLGSRMSGRRSGLFTVDLRPHRAIFIEFRPFYLQISAGVDSISTTWQQARLCGSHNSRGGLPTRAGHHEPHQICCLRTRVCHMRVFSGLFPCGEKKEGSLGYRRVGRGGWARLGARAGQEVKLE